MICFSFSYFNKIILSAILFLLVINFHAFGYNYSIDKSNNHNIHIITISKDEYEAEIVKAYNANYRYETIKNIAERKDCKIAINGFLENNNKRKGLSI